MVVNIRFSNFIARYFRIEFKRSFIFKYISSRQEIINITGLFHKK